MQRAPAFNRVARGRNGLRKASRLLVGLAALAVACQEKPAEPTGPILPPNGEIRLELTTPNADDRAILLTVTGSITGLKAANGFTAYVGTEGTTTTAALVRDGGESIPTGGVVVATLTVDAPSAEFSVKLAQVATRSHALRSSLAAYSLRMRTD